MDNKQLPLVIAVAAVSGGGKTTITSHLKANLKNTDALFFDDYNLEGPDDFMQWIKEGSNPNAWYLTPFLDDLKKLLHKPLKYIFLDFPFAYLHNEISQYIDFAIFIDTPLDIAMARRILRDFNETSIEQTTFDLENYLIQGRIGYLNMLEIIKPNSDIIINGVLPVLEITNIIVQQIEQL